MKIVVISHTNHFYNEEGQVVGWGPTIKEIDHLAEHFGEVVHVACLHGKEVTAPSSSLPYSNKNVKFVPIPTYGGVALKDKISIITSAATILRIVSREVKNADVFQFRAPTSMGMYVIPYLSLFSKKNGWYKYAGNWVRKEQPFSYTFQRWWLLTMQRRKITINGKWPNQHELCYSFENPCIEKEDRVQGNISLNDKSYDSPYRLCFVGRLDKEKGIYQMLDALNEYPKKEMFECIDIVGDSKEREDMEAYAQKLSLPVTFHGALPRKEVFGIYSKSHMILLPSESEGFPKVIAEAANFGCVPVVSNVSSIGHYVNESNGYLWKVGQSSFQEFFQGLEFKPDMLKSKSKNAYEMAGLFTFDRYMKKLEEEII